MTVREWLDIEIDAGRLPARPPEEALCLAAVLLSAATTTKTPGTDSTGVFIREDGNVSATSTTA